MVNLFGSNFLPTEIYHNYNLIDSCLSDRAQEHGEAFMRQRFKQSAVRLLKNIFCLGLFENPYLDPQESKEIVGNPEFRQVGYEVQLQSVVILKNKENVLPIKERQRGYIPAYTSCQ